MLISWRVSVSGLMEFHCGKSHEELRQFAALIV